MKTLAILLLILFFLLPMKAQVANQPDCLGLTLSDASENYNYVTVFGDGTYGLTAKHYSPAIGAKLTFGDGSKTRVKSVYTIRGGYYGGMQYDLALVDFTSPVTVTPAQVWWNHPKSLVGNQNKVKIFGLDGWVDGMNAYIKDWYSSEIYNGLWYSNPLIRPGYSGAPIFFEDSNGSLVLLGLNWGAWVTNTSPPYIYGGGVANLLYMVFEEYWELFPDEFQPPSEPKLSIEKAGDQIVLTLKSPAGREFRVTSTPNMSSVWNSVESCEGFLGYEECPQNPWEKVLNFNPTVNCGMFFRGEEIPQALELAPSLLNMQSMKIREVENLPDVLVVP